MTLSVVKNSFSRPVPISMIVLLAIVVHAPLLLMQVPVHSYDANTHMFFASHYAHHWFDPWNPKWYAGFSQTAYPPLSHQLIAFFSPVLGIVLSYMFVNLMALIFLPIGVYRFAKLWVDERSASYAGLLSVLLGSMALATYQSGQLPTVLSAAFMLNMLPYLYEFIRFGRMSALVKGVLLGVCMGTTHHFTLLFATPLFVPPVLWKAFQDHRAEHDDASSAGIGSRIVVFAVLSAVLLGIVLLPYWLSLLQNPIKQVPIPHGSRDNYILQPLSGFNFWVIPYGAMILALPWMFLRGTQEKRLRPLFVFFFITFIFGLGGTTPIPRLLLGRAFDIVTFERYSHWATLLAMPIVGLVVAEFVDRFGRKAAYATVVLAALTFGLGVAWVVYRPIYQRPVDMKVIADFLNHDQHDKFRYITLGFGNQFSELSRMTDASSVDGDYNSGRLLPELTSHAVGQLFNAKNFGTEGMTALRDMLKHADRYGLRFIFVRDRYYEPLLAFAGWREVGTFDEGAVSLWSNDDIPPAHKIDFLAPPPAWEGILWGLLPMGALLLALLAIFAFPGRMAALEEPVELPEAAGQTVLMREAK